MWVTQLGYEIVALIKLRCNMSSPVFYMYNQTIVITPIPLSHVLRGDKGELSSQPIWILHH